MANPVNPAEHLVGHVINDKWLVEEPIRLKDADSTGGFFSIPYKVRNKETGQRAFMYSYGWRNGMLR